MKKILFATIVTVFYFSVISAQDGNIATNQVKMLNQFLHSTNPYLFEKDERGILKLNFDAFKGSPYQNNEFVGGVIVDELNNKKQRASLRYNIYNDQNEIKKGVYQPIEGLLKEKDISCVINGHSYHYLTFVNEKGYETDGYLILLYKGKNYSLYKRLIVKFTPKESTIDNSYKRPKQASFTQRTFYYLKKGNTIAYLPYKKKLLYKKYPELSKDLKEYISKVHPNLKKKDDLIGLVRHLDSKF